MSHELRTPLNSVIGFSGILLGGMAGDLTEEQGRQVEMISNAGRHLLDLINDVLDLAKVEAGKFELEPEAFVPVDVLEEVSATVQPLAQEKGLSLSMECDREDCPTVWADRRKMHQVLLNLLGNAVKFTEEGTVTVSCRCAGPELTLSVADTGVGIAEEDLPTIFEEFRQLEAQETGKPKGTGLGLPLSRKLARMMGGDIAVRSAPGEGSVFEVTIPVQEPPVEG
jgi:signal transduction histidine kinase